MQNHGFRNKEINMGKKLLWVCTRTKELDLLYTAARLDWEDYTNGLPNLDRVNEKRLLQMTGSYPCKFKKYKNRRIRYSKLHHCGI